MNLTEQTINEINEINLQDALNASLLKLKVTVNESTVAPSSNDLIIYVDTESSSTPTSNRKEYIFNLEDKLKCSGLISDELLQQFKIINDEIVMETTVTRKIGTNESGNYVLSSFLTEQVESVPIELFSGTNYIYTNYTDADLTIIYPKDNDENRVILNNAIYYKHKTNNVGEFSLEDIYFKDAFTKTADNLNLEVNNASVDCITSNNNNFSLDSDGNLTVNSITSVENSIDNQSICNLIYPVGSIYLSVNNTSPSILFGGTWVVWGTGRVPVGVNTNDPNFNTVEKSGGAPTVALDVTTLPNHKHYIYQKAGTGSKYGVITGYGAGSGTNIYRVSNSTTISNLTYTDDANGVVQAEYTGDGLAHNNLQPYITCYMWKRTS